jgi:hypothetical protein
MRGGNRAVLAAVLAIGVAAIIVAVLTRPVDQAQHANSLDQVVAQVQKGFGDGRIAGAREHGSTLDVVLARGSSGGAALMKTRFETQVLAAAVAEWMRSERRRPVTTVDYRDRGGDRIGLGEGLVNDVPSTSGISSLRPGECESVARASVASKKISAIARTQPPLALAFVRTLLYLHGTCVFRFTTSVPVSGTGTAPAVLAHIIRALGDPNERPWYFEVDDERRKPQDAASWMPGVNGSTWARSGLSYAMAHG